MTVCNPMDCSTPGHPVPHYLLECAQTHVHWINDAIQPSHSLSSLSPSCLQSFQALGSFPMSWLFASGSQSIGASASASVLPMNFQGWFSLELTGLISLLSKGLSRLLSSTTVWKHQFFSAQPSLWTSSHIGTWLLEKPCEVKGTQSCPTLCNPMASTVHGILQARILERVAVLFSRGSSQPQESNPGLLHCRQILYQLSHQGSPGKTIALTIWTFVGKVMSLLFNMPSRFVIAFLPRSKRL